MSSICRKIIQPACSLSAVASVALPVAFREAPISFLAGILTGLSTVIVSLILFHAMHVSTTIQNAELREELVPKHKNQYKRAAPPGWVYVSVSVFALSNAMCTGDTPQIVVLALTVASVVCTEMSSWWFVFFASIAPPAMLYSGFLPCARWIIQSVVSGSLFGCVSVYWARSFDLYTTDGGVSLPLGAVCTLVLFSALTSIVAIS